MRRVIRFSPLLVPALAFALSSSLSVAPLASAAEDESAAQMATSSRIYRLHELAPVLAHLANETPGLVAVTIGDLGSGHAISVNGGRNLPAASTIKIAVMVEVLRQVEIGDFTLGRTVSLLDEDRDCGYGDLCDAPHGSRFTVHELLASMIDDSDNTAANMLIRLVGRWRINATMEGLGLDATRLGDSIRSDGDIRALRTSADDMAALLEMIAAKRVVSEGASDYMLRLLARQRHNTLLPALLPKGLIVEHKTGTLHDTLNDVGIVQLRGAPYVICTFSTHLTDLDDGERFIRNASRLTFLALSGDTR